MKIARTLIHNEAHTNSRGRPVMWTAAAAAVWGAAAGWLILPALHRLAVPAGTPWRTNCPAGHALSTGPRGWLHPICPTGAHHYASADRTTLLMPSIVTAAVCALLAAATGAHPELAAYLLLTPAAVLLALIDARVHRLPDRLTLPLAAAALALLSAASLVPGAQGSATGAVLGALVLAGAFLLMFVISPRAMGFGDVKLALTTGAVLGWYGWRAVLVGIFACYLIAAAQGIALIVRRKATRTTALPFGPALLAGTLIGTIWGAALS